MCSFYSCIIKLVRLNRGRTDKMSVWKREKEPDAKPKMKSKREAQHIRLDDLSEHNIRGAIHKNTQ